MADPDDPVNSEPQPTTDVPAVLPNLNNVSTESSKTNKKLTPSLSPKSGKPKLGLTKTTDQSVLTKNDTDQTDFRKKATSSMKREIVATFYTAKLFLPKLSPRKILYYAQLIFQYYHFVVPLIDYGTDCANAGTDMIFSFRRQKKFIG